ncbi:MAG: hypothetical protein BMS9Abin15_1041 [Gammaproteobacteria bacterium]|nr:MAG: hypothetical protein BMS9Abin15_1041 [Gammaproteobacteria bacterium]
MRIFLDRITRDLSRLEMAFAVILISGLIWVIFQRSVVLLAHAERAYIQATIANLQRGLTMTMLEMILTKNYERIASLDGANPFEQAASSHRTAFDTAYASAVPAEEKITYEAPERYLGVLTDPDLTALQKGRWYFDGDNKELVYLVEYDRYFDAPGQPPPARIRFKARLQFHDINGNGKFDLTDKPSTMTLKSLNEYKWSF